MVFIAIPTIEIAVECGIDMKNEFFTVVISIHNSFLKLFKFIHIICNQHAGLKHLIT